MDMGSSTMSIAGMATTTASGAATATPTAMSMSMGGNCKISMLWNWYTIDACFISRSWHITSSGMFAGSCIGIVLLVMSLELLRRAGKEYDRYILRQHQRTQTSFICQSQNAQPKSVSKDPNTEGGCDENKVLINEAFRPNGLQQAVRATLYMVQFAVAYFVMLLAMCYNGYLIICIIIGAWLGAFVFSWESVSFSGPKEEVTVCCG